MDFYRYFLMFIIYSFIGWCIEMIFNVVVYKKVVNRGFLIGPYCPIYGFGGVLITFFLTKFSNSPVALFIMAMTICAVLEYSTGYLLEKIFKARWWDYSNFKYNINGRICLETLIPFGTLGCIIVYASNPLLFSFFDIIPNNIYMIIFYTTFIIFLSDFVFSLKVISNMRKTITNFIFKDNTKEIGEKVRETLKSKSIFIRRIIDAFPKLSTNNIVLKGIRKVKKEYRKMTNKNNN